MKSKTFLSFSDSRIDLDNAVHVIDAISMKILNILTNSTNRFDLKAIQSIRLSNVLDGNATKASAMFYIHSSNSDKTSFGMMSTSKCFNDYAIIVFIKYGHSLSNYDYNHLNFNFNLMTIIIFYNLSSDTGRSKLHTGKLSSYVCVLIIHAKWYFQRERKCRLEKTKSIEDCSEFTRNPTTTFGVLSQINFKSDCRKLERIANQIVQNLSIFS